MKPSLDLNDWPMNRCYFGGKFGCRIEKIKVQPKITYITLSMYAGKDKQTEKPIYEWHDFVAFGAVKSYLDQFQVGAKLKVQASLKNNNYEDKQTGLMKYTKQLVINEAYEVIDERQQLPSRANNYLAPSSEDDVPMSFPPVEPKSEEYF